jgi:hypothetical protein
MTDSIDPIVRALKDGEEQVKNSTSAEWKDVSENQLKAEVPNLTLLCKKADALRLIKAFNKALTEEEAEIEYEKWKASASHGMSVSDCDNIDFGNSGFSIVFPHPPIEYYVTKTFVCPVCNYEAEHHTNLEGEPKNKPFCPSCFRKAKIPIMELKGE